MRHAMLVDKAATGYSAHVPDLPGCIAAEGAREETLRLIREAVEFQLDGMRLHGEAVPEPTATVEYVEVSAEPGR